MEMKSYRFQSLFDFKFIKQNYNAYLTSNNTVEGAPFHRCWYRNVVTMWDLMKPQQCKTNM